MDNVNRVVKLKVTLAGTALLSIQNDTHEIMTINGQPEQVHLAYGGRSQNIANAGSMDLPVIISTKQKT